MVYNYVKVIAICKVKLLNGPHVNQVTTEEYFFIDDAPGAPSPAMILGRVQARVRILHREGKRVQVASWKRFHPDMELIGSALDAGSAVSTQPPVEEQ